MGGRGRQDWDELLKNISDYVETRVALILFFSHECNCLFFSREWSFATELALPDERDFSCPTKLKLSLLLKASFFSKHIALLYKSKSNNRADYLLQNKHMNKNYCLNIT